MASSSTTAISEKNIYTLLKAVWNNFKYLTDCYRGNNTLLDNEVDNLQNQTETFIAQIEIKHNTEIAFLKEGIIEENEIQLYILGLTYIGAWCRALNNFQWIYYRYTYYRNRAHIAERALRECRNHGAILDYWRDQLYDRYIK